MVVRRLRSGLGVVVLLAVSAVLVSGCVGGGAVSPSPSVSSTPAPSSTPVASPSASPSESADGGAVPVSLPCEAVVSREQMYDFSPSFVLVEPFSPDAGSLAASAVEFEGTVCRWVHETSQVSIVVSVARPGGVALEALAAEAASGSVVANVGDEAFFAVSGGVGVTQVFVGSFWLTVGSEYFASATDGAFLVDAVVGSVG